MQYEVTPYLIKALVQMQRTDACFKSSLMQSSNISISATLIHFSHILHNHINSMNVNVMPSNMTFLMIFAVFDPSPLILWIKCSF